MYIDPSRRIALVDDLFIGLCIFVSAVLVVGIIYYPLYELQDIILEILLALIDYKIILFLIHFQYLQKQDYIMSFTSLVSN